MTFFGHLVHSHLVLVIDSLARSLKMQRFSLQVKTLQAESVRYPKTLPWVGASFARFLFPRVHTRGYKDVAPMELNKSLRLCPASLSSLGNES